MHDGGEGEDEVKNDIRDDDEDDVPTMEMIMRIRMVMMTYLIFVTDIPV